MASNLLYKSSPEERIIFYSLAGTYGVYILGGMYVLGSVLGWLLLMVFLLKIFIRGSADGAGHPLLRISPLVWLWVIGMVAMLLALLIAHIDRRLGTGMTIKSTIGWAKGWALLALFPLLGNLLKVNPAIVARGCCIAAFSAVPFAIVGIVFYAVGLSGELYMSPLKAIGGPLEAFNVRLFGLNPETHLARWQFIAPWAPAAGLMSCFYLLICLQEQDRAWRFMGVLGATVMCLLCQSRAGWVIFIAIIPMVFGLSRLRNPRVWLATGVLIPALLLLAQPLYDWLLDSYTQVKQSRPGSTRVRETLARIAVQRWANEAPIWGHGIVERGPKSVEHMPIGSHHSWYGLLYVKGAVGFLALALPLALTSFAMLILAQYSKVAQASLGICIVIISYSLFENLEILVYLYWPALLWLGISLSPEAYSTAWVGKPRHPKET